MPSNRMFFNQVLPKLAIILADNPLSKDLEKILVIRDVYGRIKIAVNDKDFEPDNAEIATLETALLALGAYTTANGKNVLCRADFFDADLIFNSPEILQWVAPNSGNELRILNRQITGQNWDSLVPTATANRPPRLVFFGIKGGVGRSTALAILAYTLAQSGKNVLLVDLDLESPGLSGLLLPADRLADFGVVDWLIEDGLGQGDETLQRMVSVSPLSNSTAGQIRIMAAMGQDDSSYLDKLSRIYADRNINGKVETFTKRIQRLIEQQEAIEKPDVVLIDSRAGLHDLAAVSIVDLASTALLFATDSEQSWQGYHLLFSHWQSYPDIARKVRSRLAMVQALFPETDQARRASSFLQNAYELFSDTLYDDIPPISAEQTADNSGTENSPFNFDIEIENAPHYPMRINWNNRFQEFDPKLLDKGLFTEAEIMATYGDFLGKIIRLIEVKPA